MNRSLNRRQFIKQTTVAAAGAWLASRPIQARKISPNERLNIAMIGVANRAGDDLKEVSSENIVALCDIDENYLAAAKQKYPQAKTYNDFRRLLHQKGIDAVVVGTPDHTHAVAAVAALQSGRHVYCEKPLARTVSETRIITETAREHKRVTQIGTQIHAGSNYRRVVELVQSGAVGPVREVHVWVAATYGGMEAPKETPPVPPNLHYDLWLGPVEYRSYSPEYLPFKWRNWWAFGGGALADFGCHYMDLPHWALGLSYPLTVEPVDGPPVHPESTPPWLIVRYEYPARGEKPAVRLTWYHGGKQPPLLSPEQAAKWKSGVLFIGAKGMLLADYGRRVLLPERDFEGFKPPTPFLKDSIGHHKEWIEACKGNGKTFSSFDMGGPLTELAQLANLATLVEGPLEFDTLSGKILNSEPASNLLHRQYRKGWSL